MTRTSTAEAVDAVALTLRDEILLGTLSAGRRMTEDELMGRFDVKRHIARSALHQLVDRGLAERLPNAGVSVKSFTDKEVRDLYETRILLESSAAKLIELPVPQEDLSDAVRAQEDHRYAAESGELLSIIEANDRFHSAVFTLAGNTVLSEAIRLHAQKTAPIRFLNVSSKQKMSRSVGEHALIMSALQSDDSERLAQLCGDHLRPTRDAYLAADG
ncbi:GntR family transcriptional regulator [Brevibacterium aurantiacum]|uniref:DNA-binding transcriptional regulator, GntR family n=1 Tax=Brevibacterium aurantiacum TaxID=273384 RepID=A0A2H1KNN0_BREAU|nr:GntR family transcriptional regulator [Brevibacterium aurantiacum]SMY01208.1 DNA-binding transcriptional regulator, GntR family [Brevibacterium aurantiacum]